MSTCTNIWNTNLMKDRIQNLKIIIFQSHIESVIFSHLKDKWFLAENIVKHFKLKVGSSRTFYCIFIVYSELMHKLSLSELKSFKFFFSKTSKLCNLWVMSSKVSIWRCAIFNWCWLSVVVVGVGPDVAGAVVVYDFELVIILIVTYKSMKPQWKVCNFIKKSIDRWRVVESNNFTIVAMLQVYLFFFY